MTFVLVGWVTRQMIIPEMGQTAEGKVWVCVFVREVEGVPFNGGHVELGTPIRWSKWECPKVFGNRCAIFRTGVHVKKTEIHILRRV